MRDGKSGSFLSLAVSTRTRSGPFGQRTATRSDSRKWYIMLSQIKHGQPLSHTHSEGYSTWLVSVCVFRDLFAANLITTYHNLVGHHRLTP